MKKYFFALFLVFGSISQAVACEICGCGVGANYVGILPEFQQNILGIRHRYNHLFSHIGPQGNTTYLTSNEQYHTTECWGSFAIKKKWRTFFSIPFQEVSKTQNYEYNKKTGIGDINLQIQYQLLNKKTSIANKLLVQSCWVGVGIKLATGSYSNMDKSTTSNANLFQLGTGSTDWQLSAMYDARLQDIGINIATAYRINALNKFQYAYGNKFNTNAQVYYKIKLNNSTTLAPNSGISFESSTYDLDKQQKVDLSGGNIIMATIGLETNLGKCAIGANWQHPLQQNLAMGIVQAQNKCMLHFAFKW